MAMLNGQPQMPISSLRSFIGLVEEVQQVEVPESYWQHVRSKAEQLERGVDSNGTVGYPLDCTNGLPFHEPITATVRITGMAEHFTGINHTDSTIRNGTMDTQ